MEPSGEPFADGGAAWEQGAAEPSGEPFAEERDEADQEEFPPLPCPPVAAPVGWSADEDEDDEEFSRPLQLSASPLSKAAAIARTATAKSAAMKQVKHDSARSKRGAVMPGGVRVQAKRVIQMFYDKEFSKMAKLLESPEGKELQRKLNVDNPSDGQGTPKWGGERVVETPKWGGGTWATASGERDVPMPPPTPPPWRPTAMRPAPPAFPPPGRLTGMQPVPPSFPPSRR